MSNAVLEAIERRSSTRAYTGEAVSREDIDSILYAGLQAPTGMNKRELFFSVVRGDDPIIAEIEAEKLRLYSMEPQQHNSYYEAPVVIILSADEEFKWTKVDSGIAVENMAIAAEALGLGSLIVGSTNDALRGDKCGYFKEKLGIPADKTPQIAIAIGHKADSKEPHSFDLDSQVKMLI